MGAFVEMQIRVGEIFYIVKTQVVSQDCPNVDNYIKSELRYKIAVILRSLCVFKWT